MKHAISKLSKPYEVWQKRWCDKLSMSYEVDFTPSYKAFSNFVPPLLCSCIICILFLIFSTVLFWQWWIWSRIIYCNMKKTCIISGVARGAARPGCHHFGVTPYYKVKPYLLWFVGTIFFPSSFGPKSNQFSGEDLFFYCLWTSHISGPKTHLIWRRWPFFLVFTYFWTEKEWHHEIPPRVPPSLATPLCIVYAF